MDGENVLLKAALGYAKLGWKVFPLHWVNAKKCSCGDDRCEHPGKHPFGKLAPDGFHNATGDTAIIKRWWSEYPQLNIGIATGKVSGFFVLDLDSEEARAEAETRGLPRTFTVRTPRPEGGYHFYFKHPGGSVKIKSRGGWLEHVDTKGDGGYVVAPPSSHTNGHYQVLVSREEADLTNAPEWLFKLMEAERRGKPTQIGKFIAKGTRNVTLTSLAGSMARRNMSEEAIFQALKAENEIRCRPPLEEGEVRAIVKSISKRRPAEPPPRTRPAIFTALELSTMELPEPRWIVPGILPEGLTLLAGKAKVGKSWLCLALGIGIASGGKALGKIPLESGRVLYLALEDSKRRLKSRLEKMLEANKPSELLSLTNKWPRMGIEGGLLDLNEWLQEHSDTRLIMIDTLARVREVGDRQLSAYDLDYQALDGLQNLARQHEGLGIIVVHHLRKAPSEDPIEMVSGTMGLTGCADSLLILKRSRGRSDAELFVTGRDVEECLLALKWDATIAQWNLLGDAEDYRISKNRQEILELLRVCKEPLSTKELQEMVDLTPANLRKLLSRMVDQSLIKKEGRGKYTVTSVTTSQKSQVSQASQAKADLGL